MAYRAGIFAIAAAIGLTIPSVAQSKSCEVTDKVYVFCRGIVCDVGTTMKLEPREDRSQTYYVQFRLDLFAPDDLVGSKLFHLTENVSDEDLDSGQFEFRQDVVFEDLAGQAAPNRVVRPEVTIADCVLRTRN